MGCLDRGGGHFIESPTAGDGRFYSIVWSTDHSLDGQGMGSKDVALLFDTLINWNLIRLSEGFFFFFLLLRWKTFLSSQHGVNRRRGTKPAHYGVLAQR